MAPEQLDAQVLDDARSTDRAVDQLLDGGASEFEFEELAVVEPGVNLARRT